MKSLVALGLATFVGGLLAAALVAPVAAIGWSLGVLGTAAAVGALWGPVRLLARVSEGHKVSAFAALLSVNGVLAGIAMYGAGAIWIQRQNAPGPGAFLAGMALVYCLLIGWSVQRRPPE
ncbi:MAG: hypothetical protein Fur0036_07080 [Fimbriimonadaceae bacterium]